MRNTLTILLLALGVSASAQTLLRPICHDYFSDVKGSGLQCQGQESGDDAPYATAIFYLESPEGSFTETTGKVPTYHVLSSAKWTEITPRNDVRRNPQNEYKFSATVDDGRTISLDGHYLWGHGRPDGFGWDFIIDAFIIIPKGS